MTNTGEAFPLEDDSKILQINSPRANLSGPYIVVFKNLTERWAIVAIEWDEEPRLAIRWFWDGGGNPFSSGNGTWLVVPPSLSRSMLSGLPLDHAFSRRLDDFLSGVIPGSQLNA
jgi:hypothetical protein